VSNEVSCDREYRDHTWTRRVSDLLDPVVCDLAALPFRGLVGDVHIVRAELHLGVLQYPRFVAFHIAVDVKLHLAQIVARCSARRVASLVRGADVFVEMTRRGCALIRDADVLLEMSRSALPPSRLRFLRTRSPSTA
jgi:hypothetical protein